jgi:hypothetical protein
VFSRDSTRLEALIVWRGSFIATGCDVDPETSFCTSNFILSSPDGDSWITTELPILSDFGFRSLHLIDDRLFGLGYGQYDDLGGAIIITSIDGRAWKRVESASFKERAIDDIVETPFGTFAIGIEAPYASDNTSGFLLWPVRADGTFDTPRSGSIDGGPGIVNTALWTGDELVARGGELGPWGGPPIVQASRDGAKWSVRGAVSERVVDDVMGMTQLGDRLIAVGNRGRQYPLTPIAWISDDHGRTWTRADVEGQDAAMYTVSLEDDRLIARGRFSYGESSRPASWESVDGSKWTLLPNDTDLPDLLGYSPLTRATLAAGRTCVSDLIDSGESFRGAIYCR